MPGTNDTPDTTKRGPGRPKATAATQTPGSTVNVPAQPEADLSVTEMPAEQFDEVFGGEPAVILKLVFQGGFLGWRPVESRNTAFPIAYGWTDGLVTWGETRG